MDATRGRGRGCGAASRSRRKSQIATNARIPGITASQRISRIPIDATRTRARAGPATAPRVSPARWKPKALPRSFFSTDFERIASRAGLRIPLPIHPTSLPASTPYHEDAMATIAGKTAVATEPPSANSRRLPSLSAKYPEKSLTKLDAPSLRPSIIPRAKTGAPRRIRNEGRRTVTDSYPRSPKKLASPAPTTIRFSHPGHFITVYQEGIPDKS